MQLTASTNSAPAAILTAMVSMPPLRPMPHSPKNQLHLYAQGLSPAHSGQPQRILPAQHVGVPPRLALVPKRQLSRLSRGCHLLGVQRPGGHHRLALRPQH